MGRRLLATVAVIAISLIPVVTARPAHAAGASLYLSPTSGAFVSDSTFAVSVLVNTGGQAINAVAIGLTFPPDKLQVVAPVQSSSFVAVWIAPPSFSNTAGTINLEGGAPHPGLNSSAGNILTITFRAKAAGVAKIKFTTSSRVLANDGIGTNILTATNDAAFSMTPKPPDGPILSSSTHPDQGSWYKNADPVIAWESKSSVEAISWSFDQNPATEPDTVAEPTTPTISPVVAADGVWHFHLRIKSAGVWGGTSHFTLRVDTTAPAEFTPTVEPSRVTISDRPVVNFITTDATSGIDRYEIKVDGLGDSADAGFFTEQQSPYIVPTLTPGRHQITVRAFDRAGNITEGKTDVEVIGIGGITQSQNVWRWLIPLIVLIAVLVWIRRSNPTMWLTVPAIKFIHVKLRQRRKR